jgi:alkanesulfonate monooxygenase SsuD/methylene tetrahydromethanopterin reductase-like flavin-dependent oxidoreductase (luciferase family)
VGELNFDYTKVEDAEAQLRSRVAGQVQNVFSGGQSAAQIAATLNGGYLTTPAMLAMFAQIASAIERLTQYTSEHADLLRTASQRLRLNDDHIVTKLPTSEGS